MEPNSQNGQQQIADTAKSVAEHASTLTRLEIELALLEWKKKGTKLATGIGLAVAAGFLGLLGAVWVIVTATAGLSTVFEVWVACAMMTAILLLAASIIGIVAIKTIRKVADAPLPEQALEQAKLTGLAIKG